MQACRGVDEFLNCRNCGAADWNGAVNGLVPREVVRVVTPGTVM